jgi:hypothetical protein
MAPIQKSGLAYPNKFGVILVRALEEVMGRNGLNAILNLAGLSHYIENPLPDNLEKGFDFAEVAAVNMALEDMYGPRGGRGLSLRVGRALFADGLRNFGALAGVGDLAFKVLPLGAKLQIGLPAVAKIFSTISDQHSTVTSTETEYIYTIHKCSECHGRSGQDKPICFIATGILQESLKWVSGGNEFRVNESKCVATGDDVCEYVIQKEPLS